MSWQWLILWACVLTIGWLLPSHHYPWLAFHTDAWVASVLLIATAWVCRFDTRPLFVPVISVVLVALIVLVGAQTLVGVIDLSGIGWISALYLLGLLLAILTGAKWESRSPGQLGDGLFLAIGIAAILSVGLQLKLWLQIEGFEGLEFWALESNPSRPSANIGQPNQLGTLLLWGVLAAVWGWVRGYLRGTAAVTIILYLCFGVALTASRTAWIAVILLIGFAWIWRGVWPYKFAPVIATFLGIAFAFINGLTNWLPFALNTTSTQKIEAFTVMSGQVRLIAWETLGVAALNGPFWGYGFNQVAKVQITSTTDRVALENVFAHSHNLFLDLTLWCGLFIGFSLSLFLIWWLWTRIKAVHTPAAAVVLMAVVVVANHSMLELPLHYAYFLLPTGMMIGMLDRQLGIRSTFSIHRAILPTLWFTVATMFCVVVYDYFRIEESYDNLRWEEMRFKVQRIPAPDVVLLTHWRHYIDFARYEPRSGEDEENLVQMRKLAANFPTSFILHKMATTLALNGQPEEAAVWLVRLCKNFGGDCLNAKKIWLKQANRNSEIAAIAFPVAVEDSAPKND
jgi:hypothetical protein